MRRFVFLLALIVAAPARADQPADVAFFEAKVRPLLAENCHACHGAKKQRGGLRLDSRAALLHGGDSGPAVVPGHPEKSLLIRAVRHTDPNLRMPEKGKLPDRAIAVLEEWVRRGVAYPGSATPTAGPKIDLAQGRTFWSFRPLHTHAPPALRDHAWPRRRIDAFVLAKLEAKGLMPSAEASRRVLIRRLSFDLVGLPPSPAEIDAFLADDRTDAYERLVDRLLASPHHGERWARHWLDLTRYCDITEEWFESKGAPHLYRDWVIKALNDDMPYDQFVQRQIAADLMPEARPEDIAALGFLGLSPTYWKELKLAPEVIKGVVAEEWEERIGALTGTFLGLTVGCARCHDHKFDPITMHDYYALAGVLASTRLTDRWPLPAEQARAAQQARARIAPLKAKLARPGTKKQADELRQQIDAIRREVPQVDVIPVPGLDEASVYVQPDGPARTKIVYKAGLARDVAMQLRGSPTKLGPLVPRRFLAVLSPTDTPPPFKQGSGRRELARALVTEGAPLAARVLVNRVWRHHFGKGLVETPSDFGTQGERPSHPELLDDLAARFVANGWSLRWLHREIVLSATYRQTSDPNPRQEAADPDNRLLGRMSRRRLEVEAWRDAMLTVTGMLDPRPFGPAAELTDAANRRRTIYGTVKRREISDVLRLNDFPDPTTHSAARVPTTTPLQQLYTLNSPFLRQQAQALVRRLKTDAGDAVEPRIRRAYLLLYGRPATAGQLRLAIEFLTEGRPGMSPSVAAWELYAQALLGSNEFAFVD